MQKLSTRKMYAFSTRGRSSYASARYQPGDVLVFGCETAGLPAEVWSTLSEENRLRLPMIANSRSLNLSNAVAVVVYEAWRQNDFESGVI